MKKIVFIVGAGRSGTSVITRALQVLEVDLGNTLMPANPEFNKKGYFEDLDFFDFNNLLFEEIGSTWHDLSVLAPHTTINTKLYNNGNYLLKKKMHNRNLFGVKDPQISRIIPFWSEIANQNNVLDHYVIALRNPLSAARSLSRYANFTLARCFEIWFIFTLQALSDSARHRRIVTSYENVLKNPAHEISRIATLICVDFKSDSELFRSYSEDFIDNSDNRNCVSTASNEEQHSLPKKVENLYDFLLRLADDRLDIESPDAQATIEHFREIRRNDLSLAGIVTAQDRTIGCFQKDFDVANQTIQSLLLDRDAHKAANESSSKTIVSLRESIANISAKSRWWLW